MLTVEEGDAGGTEQFFLPERGNALAEESSADGSNAVRAV